MFENLGAKAVVVPLGIALFLFCLLGTVVAPMLHAEPRSMPFAIVNLDQGATTVLGSNNVGDTLTDNLMSGEASLVSSDDDEGSSDDDSSMDISWTELDSEQDALDALANNEYYGAIIIPANFTSQQMSTLVGSSSAPELKVYLNKGKNPQAASTMQTTLETGMLKAGVGVDVEMVNDRDLGATSYGESMMVQMLVMPLFMMTMMVSILTSMIFWRNDATGLRAKNRWLALLAQLGIIVVFSAVVSALAMCVDCVIGGINLPVADLYPFVWFISLCTMTAFVGLCDLCFPLGAVIAVGTFALGTGTAMFAPEMLPDFWATWICPWAPQAHLGNGVRQIVYFSAHPSGADVIVPAITCGIGLVALFVATLISRRGKNKPTEAAHADGATTEAAGA